MSLARDISASKVELRATARLEKGMLDCQIRANPSHSATRLHHHHVIIPRGQFCFELGGAAAAKDLPSTRYPELRKLRHGVELPKVLGLP